jgi:hypothetical protein
MSKASLFRGRQPIQFQKLTRGAGIKLNARVSLRGYLHAL